MFDALNNNQFGTPGLGYENPSASLGFGSSGFTPQTGMLGSQLGGQNQGLFGFGDAAGMSGLQMGQLGLGALSGLANGYFGFQNMKLAQNQAKQAQQNWDKQWNANVKSTNTSLADRQKARVASNPNAYESVDSYMKKYGIS